MQMIQRSVLRCKSLSIHATFQSTERIVDTALRTNGLYHRANTSFRPRGAEPALLTYMTGSIEMEVLPNKRSRYPVVKGGLVSFEEAHPHGDVLKTQEYEAIRENDSMVSHRK
jgi:hypothetical protein